MSNAFEKLAEKIGVVVQGGNVNIGQLHVEENQPKRSKNEQLLLRQVKREVYSRLEQSLHSKFITLHKELQPKKVKRIWDADIKIGLKESEPLPEETSLLDIFNRDDIDGRLLILGQPGSGKTTTQLELAKALIECRVNIDTTFPIPVLLNISSWRSQSITYWLTEELRLKYGVRSDITDVWIKEKKLLFLLDGLDELKTDLQETCVNELNKFLTRELAPEYVVICCRSEEYSLLNSTLKLSGAILLKPLSEIQIYSYLSSIKQKDLWLAVSKNTKLLEAVKTPLMLSVLTIAHQELTLEEWKVSQNSEHQIQILWNAYLKRMLSTDFRSSLNNKINSNNKHLRCWLIWLAKQLERENNIEFSITSIQPSWISLPRLYHRYRLGVQYLGILSIGFMSSILLIPLGYLTHGLIGLLAGLFLTLFSALIYGYMTSKNRYFQQSLDSIDIKDSWNFSLTGIKAVPRKILFYFLYCFMGMSVLNMVLVAIIPSVQAAVSIFSLFIVFLALLIISLILIIQSRGGFLCFSGVNENYIKWPNQGVISTLKVGLFTTYLNGLISAFIGLVTTYSLSMLLFLLAFHFMESVFIVDFLGGPFFAEFSSLTGALIGWIIGLSYGCLHSLNQCIKYFVIRRILHRSNYIPRNYSEFLDYSADRLIMQRIGGRYRFIHKQLQEHFAAMPLDTSKPKRLSN